LALSVPVSYVYWSVSWNVTNIESVRKKIEAKELEIYYINL